MHITDGVNNEIQQKMNRALVIDLLRKEGLCSRANLAEISNLNRTTITNIINDFINCGLVVETGPITGLKNSRSIGIKLNGKNFRVVGVMITQKKYWLLSMGISGEIFGINEYPIKKGARIQEIVSEIKNSINKIINSSKEYQTLAIGISMPGSYKRELKDINFIDYLSVCTGVHIYKESQEAYTIPIYIENDANAGAYAMSWNKGRKSLNKDLAYIVAGQCIVCGVVVNGRILTGEKGLAGEIGHTSIKFDGNHCECGNIGCLDTYCSTIAIRKRLRESIKNYEETILKKDFNWNDFVSAVNKGDEVACREYKTACKFLAVGIVNLIYQLNLGVVVIGDQLAQVKPELMYELIISHVKTAMPPSIFEGLKIEVDNSEINPIIIGSAAIAAQKVLEAPFDFIKQNPMTR